MLTTDTNVQLRIYRLTKLDSHLHQLADTGLIQLSERIVLEDLGIIVSVQDLPASSREKPKVIWVRSLVPKQKKSASLGSHQQSELLWGLDHGTYFVLHIYTGSCNLSISCLDNYLLNELSSFTSHTRGIMISGSTFQSGCAFLTSIAARITALVCILAISG